MNIMPWGMNNSKYVNTGDSRCIRLFFSSGFPIPGNDGRRFRQASDFGKIKFEYHGDNPETCCDDDGRK